MSSFRDRLQAAGPTPLAALLALRPAAVAEPLPRNLGELASRLDDPGAVSEVLHGAPLACLQLSEALQALGGRATRAALADLLENVDTPADLDPALAWLTARAVVREVGPDVLEGSPGLAACFPAPLRLGPPLAALLADETADSLRRMLTFLGQSTPRLRSDALKALTRYLSEPGNVRRIVAQAPPATHAWLVRQASGDEPGGPPAYDPAGYRVEQEALKWAGVRGLVLGQRWGYLQQMPGEVARALRGPGFRAAFAPRQPPVASCAVGAHQVASEAAAAAAMFGAHASAVLDRLARTPVPLLKSGGVGAREITRLAKATACRDTDVRLVLELADECGLLDVGEAVVTAGADAHAWRAAEPAERYADLAVAWWHLGMVPSEARADGKAVAALRRPGGCRACAGGRHGLLSTLAALPPGRATTLVDVGPAAIWGRPLVHAQAEPDDVPYGASWAEAEALGVIAHGALSEFGAHLVAGDRAALTAAAAAVLPATSDDAAFGADLTVVVAGTPSARVTDLLDNCADRESRGAAVVWRLSPGSVRRALDDGMSGEQLERELAAVARNELPQPVRYLIGDVARRHGSVRVRPAVSVLHGDDAALLAQAAGDRSLKRLGLALLAPTVLTSQKPVDETVTALRAAGYLPMPEDADGSLRAGSPQRPVVARPQRRRARAEAPAVDLLRLATALCADRPTKPAGVASLTARTIGSLAPRLPTTQARLLAHAIDEGLPVVIDYMGSTGGRTQRTVDDLQLVGGSVQAWCQLRQAERVFTLSRIQSVRSSV